MDLDHSDVRVKYHKLVLPEVIVFHFELITLGLDWSEGLASCTPSPQKYKMVGVIILTYKPFNTNSSEYVW